MSLAIAIQHYPPFIAGAERQAEFLARSMSRVLGSCDVVTTKFHRGLPARSDAVGVRILRLPTTRVSGLRLVVNSLTAFIYFLCFGHRYCIVHANCLSPFSLGAITGARLRGCKTLLRVCTIGEGGDIAKVKMHPLGRLVWRMFLQSDGFIAQTPNMVSELVGHGIPSEKISVVPNQVATDCDNALNVTTRSAARRRLDLPDKPTVLFVGRLVLQKNLELLMRAWTHVVRQYDVSLVLVGDGPEAERIREWKRNLDCTESVRLVGWQTDVDSFYRASDIFVFPATKEAFSNVVAEAMAHGLAVVTTRVGLAEHWIRDGVNGVIIDGTACNQLVATIGDLIRNEPYRERLGRQAQEDAIKSFSPGMVVGAYLELYRGLGCNKPRGRWA